MNDLTKDERYQFQLYTRHRMIERLLADIQQDLVVCSLEGWDRMEYIEMIRAEMAGFQDRKDGTGHD